VAIASSAYRETGAGAVAAPAAPAAPPPGAIAPGSGEKLVSATSTTGKPLTRPELGVVQFMAAVALLAYLVSVWFIADESSSAASFKPAEGVTVFAIFYVLAQAIERLLTPIAKLVPTTPPDDAPDAAKTNVLGVDITTRSRALKQRTAAVEACTDTSDPPAGEDPKEIARAQAQDAANWHEVLQQAYVNATSVWALGAALAFVLCAWLDIYLLNAIAVDSWNPPTWIDLLVTGLAIGGGTVPLHDLIGRIQKKDDAQAQAAPTGPTSGGGRAGVVVPPPSTR
jgi:hypothetical protein